MTRILTVFCSMLVLTACLTRRTDDLESSAQEPKDASPPSDGGKTSADASEPDGNNTAADGGKPAFCEDARCDTPELPYCDEDAKTCTTCRDGSDCAPFAGRKACVKNEGCFECNGEKAGECGSSKPLCDPKKHACVECTAEASEGCTLKGQVCEPTEGKCVECTANTHCGDPTKARCDTDANTCGKCEANADCDEFADKPYCEPASGACVACVSNANCGDPGASRCDLTTHVCTSCETATDCAHVNEGGDNLPVCNEAKCVECTRAERAECGTDVCNALTKRCAEGSVVNTAKMCDACVSDDQCLVGQRCIQTTFNTGTGAQTEGWFCQWAKAGGGGAPATCSGVRPFVSEQSRSSIDGAGSVATCTHALTSCGAYRAFRSSCGRYDTGSGIIYVDDFTDPDLPDDVENVPTTAAAITADDTKCGMAGKCVTLNANDGAYRCSHGCLTDNDCDLGVVCSGTPKFCSVN